MNAIARGDQHPQRGVDLLALKSAVERIDEQRDFRTRLGTISFAAGTETIGTPCRQASLGGQPEKPLRQFREQRNPIAQVHESMQAEAGAA